GSVGPRKRDTSASDLSVTHYMILLLPFFFFKQKTAYEIGLGIPAEPLFRSQSAAFSSGKVRPNHETNINIIARRTGKDVNSHTVLDGIITTIMATIQRINIIGSREGSRNRRRLK